MGEIAEMMLDGTLCEGCGEYIGSDAGYPQYCSPECAEGRGLSVEPYKPKRKKGQHKCAACGKRFRRLRYLEQHQLAKHEGATSP